MFNVLFKWFKGFQVSAETLTLVFQSDHVKTCSFMFKQDTGYLLWISESESLKSTMIPFIKFFF